MKIIRKILLIILVILLVGCNFKETEDIEESKQEDTKEEEIRRFEVVFAENEEFESSEKEQACNRIDPYIKQAVDILNTIDLEEIDVLDCDYSTRLKRNKINANASKIYDEIQYHVSNFEEYSYNDTILNDSNDFLTALDALKIDHSELFLYCDFSYQYPYYNSIYYLPNSWMNKYDNIEEIRSRVLVLKETINRIIEKMPTNLSNYYKCWYFTLVIALSTTYDLSQITTSHQFQAYDCLVKGKCACKGYTDAFYELCKKAGISCYRVTGTSKEERHSWNMVETESGSYYLDITWYDDDRLKSNYKDENEEYIFMDEETLILDHELEYIE